MANPLQMLKLKPQGIQFIQETLISATPKKVWAALKKPSEWFYFDANRKSKHTLELRAGGHWISVNQDGSENFFGRVVYFEPGKLLRISGQLGLTHVPVTSVVIFELQPGKDGKSTLLRVGMRMFGFLDADVKTRYEGAWQMLAGQLKALAEK
jgi:uncharacterized protein YndB with AHSA1/START domain